MFIPTTPTIKQEGSRVICKQIRMGLERHSAAMFIYIPTTTQEGAQVTLKPTEMRTARLFAPVTISMIHQEKFWLTSTSQWTRIRMGTPYRFMYFQTECMIR